MAETMLVIDSNLGLLERRLKELREQHKQQDSALETFQDGSKSGNPIDSSDRIQYHINQVKAFYGHRISTTISKKEDWDFPAPIISAPSSPPDSAKNTEAVSERNEHDELAEGLVRMARILKQNNLAMQKLIQKDQNV